MLHRRGRLIFALFCLLVFSLAYSEMPIRVHATMDSFSHDAEGASIRLESFSTRWQLTASARPSLLIDELKAKRLTVTLKPNQSTNKEGMPDNIRLPLPIKVRQSRIEELVIVSADGQQVLTDVQLAFEGDTQILKLQLAHAKTAWGEVSGSVDMSPTQPFALNGALAIKQSNQPIAYDLSARLHGDLNMLEVSSEAWLHSPQPQHWQLSSKPQDTQAPSIQVTGRLSLQDKQAFWATIHIANLHPEKLGDYPEALLNMQATLQGQLSPVFKATAQVSTLDSWWNKQLVEINAQAQLLDANAESISLQFKLGQNQITAQGSIQANQPAMNWQANFNNLAELNSTIAGQLTASGSVNGVLTAPQLKWQMVAYGLQLPNQMHIKQLQSEAHLDLAEQGVTQARLSLNAVTLDKQTPFNAEISLQGQQHKHQLVLNAEGESLQLKSKLAGGILRPATDASWQWMGQVEDLDFSGISSIKLKTPASLLLNSTQVKLGKTDLQLTQGQIVIDELTLTDNTITSQGQLLHISLNDLPKSLIELPDSLKGNPIFSGKWQIDAKDQLNAHIELMHKSGDFSYRQRDNSMAPFGLHQAALSIKIVQNQIRLAGQFDGRYVGGAKLDLSTEIIRHGNRFTLAPEAPLRLQASADLHTLVWLPMPTALMDANLDGQVSFNVQGHGTLAEPNLTGQLLGKNIEFYLPSEGIALTHGQWVANFAGKRLTVKQASWQGGEGLLTSQGWVSWLDGQPAVELDWHADKFSLLSRADRLLTLSGNGKTQLNHNLLAISGQFKVNEGLIELPSQDMPALDDDVVILGQTVLDDTPRMDILLNGLRIELGNQFSLRGRGLDAMLNGTITLNGLTRNLPHTQGSIKVGRGTFMAYGQVLTIERGILSFSGLISNPGLDIRAMRNSKPINAGVEITGNAFNPTLKLVSNPNVAESEKLAWLVLGHGLENAGSNELGMLSLAAGVLLSDGESVPMQTKLAQVAGLDEFSFTGSDTNTASLTMGKRITSQLYLSYAKSLSGLLDVARLTYNITPRWLLRAEAGTESAVDVLYTFRFK